MKFLMALMIVTSSFSSFASQNSAKDINCCQTCQTAEAIACRGMAQKRIIVDKSPASLSTKKSKNLKAKPSKANQG